MEEKKDNAGGPGEEGLAEYLVVLYKRKRLVLLILLAALLPAGLHGLLAPAVYRLDTVLEIGESGPRMPFEPPSQVREKIDGDVYGALLRRETGISEGRFPEIKAVHPNATSLVLMEVKSSDTALAREVLAGINSMILERHGEEFEKTGSLIGEGIAVYGEKIKSLEDEILKLGERAELKAVSIGRIRGEIARLEEAIDSLSGKVGLMEKIIAGEANSDGGQGLFVRLSLFDMRERLALRRGEREKLYREISFLEGEAAHLESEASARERKKGEYRAEILSLEAALAELKPSRILKEPAASEAPAGPGTGRNLVFAGLFGLFLGMCFAFGQDWLDRNRGKFR